MKYRDLVNTLVEHFPELNDAAKEEFDWWGEEEPPVHVFFGNVLKPFLEEQVSTMANKRLLERVFKFLESMALCDDRLVQEVLAHSVLEYLGDDSQILAKARAFMGPHTRAMSDEVETSWGRSRK